MPIYSLLCPGCGVKETMFRKIAERDNLPVCECGEEFSRVIDRPMVIPEITPYYSPNGTGLITSRAERREDLRRSNAIEWEPGIDRDIARRKQDLIEKSFAPIAAAVDNIVTEMNVAGKLETNHG